MGGLKPPLPRTRLQVWFIRVCSTILIWTCFGSNLWQLGICGVLICLPNLWALRKCRLTRRDYRILPLLLLLLPILPLFHKHKIIHFNRTDSRLANNGISLEIQRLRCRVNFQGLKFTPKIEDSGNKLIHITGEGHVGFLRLHSWLHLAGSRGAQKNEICISMMEVGGDHIRREEITGPMSSCSRRDCFGFAVEKGNAAWIQKACSSSKTVRLKWQPWISWYLRPTMFSFPLMMGTWQGWLKVIVGILCTERHSNWIEENLWSCLIYTRMVHCHGTSFQLLFSSSMSKEWDS